MNNPKMAKEKELLNLDEIDKLPNIALIPGYSTTPSIPIRGKCLSIPQNLLPGTKYLLGNTIDDRIGTQLTSVAAMINNMQEILSFMVCNQRKLDKEQLHKEIKEISAKQVDLLEQNRLSIKDDFRTLLDSTENAVKEVYNLTNRLLNILEENQSNKSSSLLEEQFSQFKAEIKEEIKEIKKILNDKL